MESFLEQFNRVKSGEISRNQAAEALGISVSTFNARVYHRGWAEALKPVRRYANNGFPSREADYAPALDNALDNPNKTLKEIHAGYPDLNYVVFCRKAAKLGAARSRSRPDNALDNTQFLEVVESLRTGMDTRATAAEKLGVHTGTLNKRLEASGLAPIIAAAGDARRKEAEAVYDAPMKYLIDHPTTPIKTILEMFPDTSMAGVYRRLAGRSKQTEMQG